MVKKYKAITVQPVPAVKEKVPLEIELVPEKEQQFIIDDDKLFEMVCEMVTGVGHVMPQDSGMQKQVVHSYEGAKWFRDRFFKG